MATDITIRRTRAQVDPTLLDCPLFLLQEEVCGLADEDGDPVRYWKTTEGAWFTADEARQFAEAHAHRLPKWRVYAIPARGSLKALLNAHSEPAEAA
jgi:hypothetical protein